MIWNRIELQTLSGDRINKLVILKSRISFVKPTILKMKIVQWQNALKNPHSTWRLNSFSPQQFCTIWQEICFTWLKFLCTFLFYFLKSMETSIIIMIFKLIEHLLTLNSMHKAERIVTPFFGKNTRNNRMWQLNESKISSKWTMLTKHFITVHKSLKKN